MLSTQRFGLQTNRLSPTTLISNQLSTSSSLPSKMAERKGFAPLTAYSSAGVFKTLSSSIRALSKIGLPDRSCTCNLILRTDLLYLVELQEDGGNGRT